MMGRMSEKGVLFSTDKFIQALCGSVIFTQKLKNIIPETKKEVINKTTFVKDEKLRLELYMYIALIFTLIFPYMFSDVIKYFYTDYFIVFLIDVLPVEVIEKLISIGL